MVTVYCPRLRVQFRAGIQPAMRVPFLLFAQAKEYSARNALTFAVSRVSEGVTNELNSSPRQRKRVELVL
jgi:hypothetical protein